MRAQLVPLDGGEPIEITKDLTVVGRKEDADLRLDHKSVSKLHCVIVRTDGLLLIRDLGSTNGTRVNGQRVRRAALLPNDQLSIASFRFKVYLGPGEAAPAHQNFEQHTQQMDAKDVANLLRKATAAKGKETAPAATNGNNGLAPLAVQPNILPDVYTDDKGDKDSRD
jgi:pSer/pThr/pTyr-binding forkhead associated (FHA) protein